MEDASQGQVEGSQDGVRPSLKKLDLQPDSFDNNKVTLAGNELLAVASASEIPGPFAFLDGEIEGGIRGAIPLLPKEARTGAPVTR
jgi:hypothetical protein